MPYKKLLLYVLLFVSFTVYSQDKFVAGYFIDNTGKQTDCLIENLDWLNNPKKFNYKLAAGDEAKEATILSVKEFGTAKGLRYKRFAVKIDRSSNLMSKLSDSPDFNFQEETLFLKQLIDGKADLYSFEDVNLIKYFYTVEDSEIKQLLQKSYLFKGGVAENEAFKRDLWRDFKSEKLTQNDFKNVRYNKSSLTDLFVKYNSGYETKNVVFDEGVEKKVLFHLNVRPGVNQSKISLSGTARDLYESTIVLNLETKTTFRFGIEAEFILPFNNNKWAVLIEPTYQYYKAEQIYDKKKTTVDYKSVEVPVFLRYYVFLNDKSKLFANSGFDIDLPMKAVIFFNNEDLSNNSKVNFNFGIGLGYAFNRFSVEARYKPNRGLLGAYRSNVTNYTTTSLIFGYRIL